ARGGDPVPRHRRAEDVRHHLRHDPGRARQRDRDHQSPALQPGVLLLQHGLRLVHGRRALRPRHGRLADPDQGAAEHDVVRGSARRRWLSTAGFYALAALFMLPTVFVFYWMLTLSLKPQIEATAYPPSFVRFSVTLAGYREVFTKYPFFLYTWNSLVVATGILSFVFSWNNFLFSVILAGRTTRTLPIAVYNMISYEEINWGTLAAAATLITLPVLLVALLAQRHIVTGLTFGAVKQ